MLLGFLPPMPGCGDESGTGLNEPAIEGDRSPAKLERPLHKRSQCNSLLVKSAQVQRLDEAQHAVPGADAVDLVLAGEPVERSRSPEKLHDLLSAPEVGEMTCQQRGALPGKRGGWLEFHGFAKLGLRAFGVPPPVRSQAQIDVAHVTPRQPTSFTGIQDLRTERLNLRQITEHRRLTDPVREHHEDRPQVAESLSGGQCLSPRLLACSRLPRVPSS